MKAPKIKSSKRIFKGIFFKIISNRLRFSSLINAFEDITWADAQRKERELVGSSMSNEYIDSVRSSMSSETEKIKSEVSQEQAIETTEIQVKQTPVINLKKCRAR